MPIKPWKYCTNRLAVDSDDVVFRAYTKERGFTIENVGFRPTHPERFEINDKSPYFNNLWTKPDAFHKWCACLHMFDDVAKKGMKVIDLGSGDGPICHILADQGYDVTGVDIKPWNYPYKSLAQMVIKDAITFLEEYEDESVDIFIDGCAVTHFNTNSNPEVPNFGWKAVFENVRRVMKSDGYFIVTSDVQVGYDEYYGEMISPEQIVQMAENAGLSLTSKFNYSRQNIMTRHEVGCMLGVANFLFVKK